VTGSPARGPNPKIANLIGMQKHIRHGIVVIADSDIAVAPDYLSKVVAALSAPGVGLVTCLYRGVPQASLWSRLASMAIDYDFLPNVLIGLRLGLARPCFGSTIALERETLRAVGGFETFLNHLADDNAMGEAVRAIGLRVDVPALVVAHGCPEQSGMEMLRHELRWARTVRAVNRAGYAGLSLTYPVAFALLAACASGFSAVAMAVLATALAARLVMQVQVDHTLRLRPSRFWLGPLRDLLSFCVYIAGFAVSVVTWRGDRYRVHADGTLIPLGNPKS
jgi:ceramide glucosyltransferase